MNGNYTDSRQHGKQRQNGRYPVPRRTTLPATRSVQDDSPAILKVFKSCFFGLVAFVALGVLSTLVATAVAYASPDPDSLSSLVSLIAILPPAFVGGLLTSKKAGEAPLLCGVLFALVITVTSLLLSLIFREASSNDQGSLLTSLLLRIPAIGAAVLGAIAGGKRKNSRGRLR